MQKSLDRKLAAIHADPSGSREFILADAKDADMAFGIGAPGKSPEAHAGETRFRTLAEYREQIRQIIDQGLVDIMLMSASTSDVLTIAEGRFANSAITPAARANDTSDVFVVRGGKYLESPAQPFRSALLDHIQCGHIDCQPNERVLGANLGLYSVTFNNRLEDDLRSLEEYRTFRVEAERKGFRHFLELFDPNAPAGLSADQIPGFINDHVARTLAGVAQAGRPVFLKMVYHGPRAMEELVAYDPHLVVGILGGGAGTTYDAFKLLGEAKKYGARAALFGRKINGAECQLAFVEFLRLIADGQLEPEEAVRAYHGVLQRLKIRPQRSLAEDMELRTGVMSYGGSSSATVPALPIASQSAAHSTASSPAVPNTLGPITKAGAVKKDCGCGCGGKPKGCGKGTTLEATTPAPAKTSPYPTKADGQPDFARMTVAQKVAWNRAERDRIFGF
jgi:hypothetical protein